MWANLALATVMALAPAQGTLTIKNDRLTYGVYGQKRAGNKVLPGELVVISYEIHGLKAKPDGKVQYAAGFELSKKGETKPEVKVDLVPRPAVLNLGGGVLATESVAAFGLDTKAGTYVIKLTVKDMDTKATATVTKEIVVEPKFGFVRTRFTAPFIIPVRSPEEDPFPPAPPVVVPGQSLWLHYALVGFKVDDKTKQPDVDIEVKIIDDATGKETTEKTAKARVRPAIKGDARIINFQPIPLELYRAGKYKVKLISKCRLSGATAEREFDLKVLDLAKDLK
jgi:hypothetical protein